MIKRLLVRVSPPAVSLVVSLRNTCSSQHVINSVSLILRLQFYGVPISPLRVCTILTSPILFDLILYVRQQSFSYIWTGLPGLNQY